MVDLILTHSYSLQGSIIATALHDLTYQEVYTANGPPVPRFSTLSVANQVSILLAVRAAPSKFNQEDIIALHRAAMMEDSPPIVIALAGGRAASPCPSFLFTSTPAFPWAPQLCTAEEAAKRKLAAATAAAEAQPMQLDENENRTSEMAVEQLPENFEQGNAALITAQACVRSEISSSPAQLSTECTAALETILYVAAVVGASQTRTLGTTDPLQDAGLRDLSEDTVLLVVQSAVSQRSSYSICAVVARQILCPAVSALDAPPTQSLTRAAQHLGDINPQALIEHCWQPLLGTPSSGGPLTKHQSEFIIRCIKQGAVPESLLHGILDAACTAVVAWNEHVVAVVQAVLDTRPSLPTATLAATAGGFLSAGQGQLKGSIKAAKALLSFVKSYGNLLDPGSVECCRGAAQSIGTFMAKTTIGALDKL